MLPTIGVAGMYLGLALAAVLGLLMVPSVISRAGAADQAAIEIHMLLRRAAILAMLGIGLFETANNMHFTYAERIGVSCGLQDHRIGAILAIATLALRVFVPGNAAERGGRRASTRNPEALTNHDR